MKLSISEKLRPYSHLPGTKTLLPGNGLCVQCYPTCLKLLSINETLNWKVQAPVEQFTVFNDLEKQCVTISAKTVDGWFRYSLLPGFPGLRLVVEKAPENGVALSFSQKELLLKQGDDLDIGLQERQFNKIRLSGIDRLSLGNHKAQDIELIVRRGDLREIFPLWYTLGQLLPEPVGNTDGGNMSLLKRCEESLLRNKPEETAVHWKTFWRASFNHLLFPRLEDSDHWALAEDPLSHPETSPLCLLTAVSRLIRRHFIEETEGKIEILPHLLPIFPCGRLLDVTTTFGVISLEWTKKVIRRLKFVSFTDQILFFDFRSNVRSYRLRTSAAVKGEKKSCSEPLQLEKNKCYLFDNFQ